MKVRRFWRPHSGIRKFTIENMPNTYINLFSTTWTDMYIYGVNQTVSMAMG